MCFLKKNTSSVFETKKYFLKNAFDHYKNTFSYERIKPTAAFYPKRKVTVSNENAK